MLPICQRSFSSHDERDREIRAALSRAHPHMVRAAVLSNFAPPDIQTSDPRPASAVEQFEPPPPFRMTKAETRRRLPRLSPGTRAAVEAILMTAQFDVVWFNEGGGLQELTRDQLDELIRA